MKRFLLPAIALGFSTIPLASASAAPNAAASGAALAATVQQTGATDVHWRYGYRHRPYWRHYGYRHTPHWRRYGYHRHYWRG